MTSLGIMLGVTTKFGDGPRTLRAMIYALWINLHTRLLWHCKRQPVVLIDCYGATYVLAKRGGGWLAKHESAPDFVSDVGCGDTPFLALLDLCI